MLRCFRSGVIAPAEGLAAGVEQQKRLGMSRYKEEEGYWGSQVRKDFRRCGCASAHDQLQKRKWPGGCGVAEIWGGS